jgi:hypothetical protein
MLRKYRLLNKSQQYRELGQAYNDEGNKNLVGGVVDMASGVLSGDGITGFCQGYSGTNKIVNGFEMKETGSDCKRLAEHYEREAQNSKWWHLW